MSRKISIRILVLSMLLVFPLFATAASSRQNELLVVGVLKRLYTAQADYFWSAGDNSYGTLEQLRAAGLIDETLARGEKYGYLFSIEPGEWWRGKFKVLAKPKIYRKTGVKSFYFDSGCVVRGADKTGADAGPADPVLDSCTPTVAYANDTALMQVMRSFANAEETYRSINGRYGTPSELYEAGLIDPRLALLYYHGYVFGFGRTGDTFYLMSFPATYGHSGFRSFYINETHILRGSDRQGNHPSSDDPPIEVNKAKR